MKNFKRIFIIISFIITIPIIIIGIFSIINIYSTKTQIEKSGIQTTCTIKNKWRGKCGSGSGNSITFTIKIKDLECEFEQSCGVPDKVEIGDKYYVKYLNDDPAKNLIYFDKKVVVLFNEYFNGQRLLTRK